MNAPASDTETIRQQALDWLTHLYSGSAAQADKIAFEIWLAEDARHRQHYREAELLWRDLMFAETLQETPLTATPPAPNQRPAAGTTIKRLLGGLFIAEAKWFTASLAALLVTVATAYWLHGGGEQHAVQRYTTAVGENRDFKLVDGSLVTLGAKGHLEVDFSASLRRASLISGNAWFAVTADAQRPFVVEAGTASVKVVGTAFEVRRSLDGVEVAVSEGAVKVSATPQPPGSNTSAAARQLRAGQRIRASTKRGLGAVETVDVRRLAMWRSGRFTYQNERLNVILEDLNRYYAPGVVSLLDDRQLDIRMTTSFTLEQLDQFLAALQASHPVKYQRTETGGYVISSTPQP